MLLRPAHSDATPAGADAAEVVSCGLCGGAARPGDVIVAGATAVVCVPCVRRSAELLSEACPRSRWAVAAVRRLRALHLLAALAVVAALLSWLAIPAAAEVFAVSP